MATPGPASAGTTALGPVVAGVAWLRVLLAPVPGRTTRNLPGSSP